MSRTPAAELARPLKVQHPGWRIGHRSVEAASGPGYASYVAVHRETGLVVTDATVAGLERKLAGSERP
jgi:hypothetical protein